MKASGLPTTSKDCGHCSNQSWAIAWGVALVGILALGAPAARADICCNCSSASLNASPSEADLNEAVSITYNASYCRCVGGPCWHPEGNCSLPPVTVQIFLEGGGQVFSQTISFPPSNDFNVPLNEAFSYTPTEAGLYTVVAAGTCPSASTTFTAGCVKDCQHLDACDMCGATTAPQITSNKSDNVIITECKCPKEEGEMVTVTVDAPGDAPDCYELTITNDNTVKIVEQPPSPGTWSGPLTIKLEGQKGEGSVMIMCKVYKFDDENQCWMTAENSLTLEAKPSEDCEKPAEEGGLRGGSGTIAARVLGVMRLGAVELKVRAGLGDLLRTAKITAVHTDGDIEVILPERSAARVLEVGAGLDGWILGGLGPRAETIPISNPATGLTYYFESTTAGPNPFRLQRVRYFDFTPHSSYVYDAMGTLTEIHVGNPSSTNYFSLTYHPDGRLDEITPYVSGAPDTDRAATVVYDGLVAVGLLGGTCSDCGAGGNLHYHYNAQGLLSRISDDAGNDLELFSYDIQNRLTTHQRVNTSDTMVTIETRTYATNTITIRERVSDTQERIRTEQYDSQDRVVQIDRYQGVFAIGAPPSGTPETTRFTYTTQTDAAAGINTDAVEIMDPAGVTRVTVEKKFDNGTPLFLPVGSTGGWRLPIEEGRNAFDLSGYQDGDAVLTPSFSGSVAIATLEVGRSGAYYPRALFHEPASPNPGETMCVQFSLAGGAGGFADGYASRNADNPPPVNPWLNLYNTSCAQVGQAGAEHAGWNLQAGVTYTLTITVTQLTTSPNPTNGFGLDGLALSSSPAADPNDFAESPFEPIEGKARYRRSFTRSSAGLEGASSIAFEAYSDKAAAYVPVYGLDRRAGKTDYAYDSEGRLTSQFDPAVTLLDGGGQVRAETTYAYDGANRITRQGRSAVGGGYVYTDYVYDVYGRRTRATENAAGAPGEQAVTMYEYNIFGNQTKVTDPCGRVTEMFHDPKGRVIDEVVYESGGAGNVVSQTHNVFTGNRLSLKQIAVHTGAFAKDSPADWYNTEFTYDLFGRKLGEEASGPDGGADLVTTIDYNYQEQIISQTNPDGSTMTTTYDGVGRPLQETVQGAGVAALTTQNAYDAQGRLQSTATPSGHAIMFQYDAFGRPAVLIEAGLLRYESFYDEAGDVIRRLLSDVTTGAPLADTASTFDEAGREVRVRRRTVAGTDNPADQASLAVYDIAGRLTAAIDKGDGNNDLDGYETGDLRTRNLYDALGRMTQSVDPLGVSTQFTYDGCGNLATETVDPSGLALTTSYLYDALSQKTRTTDPEGHYEVTAYDSRGNAVRVTSYNSGGTPLSQTRSTYDAGGRILRWARMADPAGSAAADTLVDQVRDTAYHGNGVAGAGKMASQTVYDGGAPQTTTYTYDGLSRALRTAWPLNPAQNYEETEYDPATGRAAAHIDSDSLGQRRTEFMYDAFDRLTRQREAAGGGEPDLDVQFQYDGRGQLVSIVQPDGTETRLVYNLLSQITDVIEDNAMVHRRTEAQFNRFGKQSKIIAHDSDGPQQETDYGYDLALRRTSVAFPDGGTFSYHYDAAGRLTRLDDPRGFGVDMGYDGRSLLVSRTVDDPGYEPYWTGDTFAYDGLARMTLARRAVDNEVVRSYTGLGYLDYEDQTVDGVAKRIEYGYDLHGHKTALDLPDGGPMLTYDYDALDHNTAISRDATLLVDYAYAGHNPLSRSVHAASAQIDLDWGYDHHRRVISMDNKTLGAGGACDLSCYTFDHDVMSNVLLNHSSGAASTLWDIDYAYDRLQRLIQALYTGGATGSEMISLDILGNRTSYTNSRSGASHAYTHNLANEYATIDAVAVLHDAAGNLVRDEQGFGYSFDSRDRLTRVFTDADMDGVYDFGETIHVEYAYDATGRRVARTAGGGTTRFYHDDQNVLAEYNGSNQRLRYYVHGTTYVDERAVMHDDDAAGAGANAADYAYALQANYSVAHLVDAAGAPVESYNYDAYGAVAVFDAGGLPISSSAYGASYFFTGRPMDALASGAVTIQYNRARYYSPAHGRWFSRDPLEYKDGLNLYQYVSSRPTSLADPSGEFELPVHQQLVTNGFVVAVGSRCQTCIDKIWDGNNDNDYFHGTQAAYHFDNCAFAAGKSLIDNWWNGIENFLRNDEMAKKECCPEWGDMEDFLEDLGRITHNVQDFYAHSNWVDETSWHQYFDTGWFARYPVRQWQGVGAGGVWDFSVPGNLFSGDVWYEPGTCANPAHRGVPHGHLGISGPGVSKDDAQFATGWPAAWEQNRYLREYWKARAVATEHTKQVISRFDSLLQSYSKNSLEDCCKEYAGE